MENRSEHERENLEKLQVNSWEPELLISGGAIFTLFQVSDIWITYLENVAIITHFQFREIYTLLGVFSLETLKWGFVLHLILRTFWLSMVCINYVYPEGIKEERIKWKKPFKINIGVRENLQVPIIRINRLCGTVMYLSVINANQGLKK